MTKILRIMIVALIVTIWISHFPVLSTNAQSTKITALGWDHTGARLSLGTEDGFIMIIDSDTLEEVNQWQTNMGSVSALAWSFDNNRIASGNYGRRVNIWQSNSGELVTSLPDLQGSHVIDIAWGTDDKEIFIIQNDGVNLSIWDIDTSQFVLQSGAPTGSEILLSPDKSIVAVGFLAPSIYLFDADTYEIVGHIGASFDEISSYPEASITIFDWSPDGKYIASGALNGIVNLWSVETGQTMFERANAYDFEGLSSTLLVEDIWFSQSGNSFTSIAGDGTYRAWDTATGEMLVDFNIGNEIDLAEVSPDRTRLAYVDEENELYIVEINDLITAQIRLKIADCVADDEVHIQLNDFLDNEDSAGFINQLEAADLNPISRECADTLLEMAHLLLEAE